MLNKIFDLHKDYKITSDYIASNSFVINNPLLIASVLLIEDRKYLKHKGVSITSLFRAIFTMHGGASTINMQLVRTLTNRREITITRKLRECLISIVIDFKYSKKAILSAYLSCAYFGVDMYGIKKLSFYFFNKKKENDFSFNESILTASMLKRPFPGKVDQSWAEKVNIRMEYIRKLYLINGKKMLEEIRLAK